MTSPPSLKELEGTVIRLLLMGDPKIQDAKLHNVEEAGLWLELQEMINNVFRLISQESSSHTLVAFVPWHRIETIFSSVEGMSLSEEAFGIELRGF
jgi:hypothetical protein